MSTQESAYQPDSYRSVWVRGYNPQTNVFTLSTVEGDEPEVIHVAPDENSTLGRKATEVLRDCFLRRKQAREAVMVVLVEKRIPGKQGEDPSTKLVIHDVVPPTLYKDRDARKIVGPDGKPISEWSEGLDEAVDRYQDAVVSQSAFQFHSLLMAHPESFEKVKDRASDIFQKLAGAPIKETSARLPDSYVTAMHGYEGDAQNPKKVRYNLLAGFREQCTAQPGTQPWFTAAANYSMQKAVLDAFTSSAVAGNKSFLQELQDELLAEKTIIAGHPCMESHEFASKSKEVALLIGAHVTAGIMAHVNAQPANPDLDEMKHPAVHKEIKAEYQNLPDSSRFDEPREIGAYLSLGETRMGRYEANIHFKIYEEQLKKVGPKVPPPLPPAQKNIMPMMLAMNRAMTAAGQPPVDAAKLKDSAPKSAGADTDFDHAEALREFVKITVADMEAAVHAIETPLI